MTFHPVIAMITLVSETIWGVIMSLPRTSQVFIKTKGEGLRMTTREGSEQLSKMYQNDNSRETYLPERLLECMFEGEKAYGTSTLNCLP